MPNRVINEVILHGVKLADIAQHILDASGTVSSGALLSLPSNLRAANVALQERALIEMPVESSSEAWNMCSAPSVAEGNIGVAIRFESAWSHPREWTRALFRTLKCDITASWLTEGGYPAHVERYFVGGPGSPDGSRWDDTEIADGSDTHRHLHKLLWGVEMFNDVEEARSTTG